jgi:DNA-binding FrmR family transcriptional regulator
MKTPTQRINILIGQLESLKTKLADKKPDCTSLVIQLKAVRSGVSALMEEVLSDEMDCCLKNNNQLKLKKILKEIIK